MRLKFKKPIEDRIADMVAKAEAKGKSIDKIILDKKEWGEFKALFDPAVWLCTSTSVKLWIDDKKSVKFMGYKVCLDRRFHKHEWNF